MNDNLTLNIYSSGTTLIADSRNELEDISGLWFQTINKGGLYAACGFFIPRITKDWFAIKGAQRVAIYCDLQIVYEGKIVSMTDVISEDAEGVQIYAIGFWGDKLMRTTWRKIWCDDRLTPDIWQVDNTLDLEDWQIDRNGRLHITPGAGSYTSADYMVLNYVAPIGETVKRITYDYDFAEKAGQNWLMSVWRSTDGVSYTEMLTNAVSGDTYDPGGDLTTQVSATGTGSVDVQLATASRWVQLRMYAGGNVTVSSRDHNHAQWSALKVYTEIEASGIRLYSIAEDIIAAFTSIFNSSTAYLTEMTGAIKTLEPFMTTAGLHSYLADILYDACQYGDDNANPWTVGVLASDKAATPNGLPVLYTAAIPDVTTGSFEYFISLDDPRIISTPELTHDYIDEPATYIIVQYRDEMGWTQTITPDDEATLTDTSYERIDYILTLGNSSYADALARGVRYLNQHKEPKWIVNGTLEIAGSVTGANGQEISACQVNAYSKRARIDGYDDFVVTMTGYDDEKQSVSFTFGQVEDVTLEETIFATDFNEPEFDDEGGTARHSSQKKWWQIADLYGPRKVEELKRLGKWGEAKAEGMAKYRDLLRSRGKGHKLRRRKG